jgi:hypothetical protein
VPRLAFVPVNTKFPEGLCAMPPGKSKIATSYCMRNVVCCAFNEKSTAENITPMHTINTLVEKLIDVGMLFNLILS